jgi:hypothetical protein
MDVPLVIACIQALHFSGKGQLETTELIIIGTGMNAEIIQCSGYMIDHQVFNLEMNFAV